MKSPFWVGRSMIRAAFFTMSVPLIALACAPQPIAMEAVSAPTAVWEDPPETKPLPAKAPAPPPRAEDPTKGKTFEPFQFPRDAAGTLLQGVLPPKSPLRNDAPAREIAAPRPLASSRLLEVPTELSKDPAYAPGPWNPSPRKARVLSTWREEGLDGVGGPGRPMELPSFVVDRPVREGSTPMEIPPALDLLTSTPRVDSAPVEDTTADVSLRQAVSAPLTRREQAAPPIQETVPNPYPHRPR